MDMNEQIVPNCDLNVKIRRIHEHFAVGVINLSGK